MFNFKKTALIASAFLKTLSDKSVKAFATLGFVAAKACYPSAEEMSKALSSPVIAFISSTDNG
jgi:hypothetical protein